ncbi:MAG: DMT family transporter [Clostridia bacterium]|nr:DMT family transporter [Clostridia bacterium]
MQQKSNAIYYVYMFLVVGIWSVSPLVTKTFYDYYSATAYTLLCALISAVSFTLLSVKKLKMLDKQYFKVAIVTGACYSLATISQKIGLQYTTPAMYAFLENTSCIIVPLLMLFMFKQKPCKPVAFASVICLLGCFVLSGANFSGGLGMGEILCALAGFLYAGNIVGTGVYAKKMDAVLYLMIQQWVNVVLSALFMVCLHYIRPEGVALEYIHFSFDFKILLLAVLTNLIVSCVCWILRTITVTKLDVTVVTITMSTPAVLTTILSVCLGLDTVSWSLILGATLIFSAVLLSGLGETLSTKKN